MLIACKTCGKKIRVDPSRFGNARVRIKCKACGRTVGILNEGAGTKSPQRPVSPGPAPRPEKRLAANRREAIKGGTAARDLGKDKGGTAVKDRKVEKKRRELKDGIADTGGPSAKNHAAAGKTLRFEIRPEICLLAMIFPVVVLAGIGLSLLAGVSGETRRFSDKSLDEIRHLTETMVAETARAAAIQCGLYLKINWGLAKEDFSVDPAFIKLAVKKIGREGFTFLVSIGDRNSPSTIWVHPERKFAGKPFSEVMQKSLGQHYEELAPTVGLLESGRFSENAAIFHEKGTDGTLREKIIFVARVEGANYAVVATAPAEEFATGLLGSARKLRDASRRTEVVLYFFCIGALAVLVVGLVLCRWKLAGKIAARVGLR